METYIKAREEDVEIEKEYLAKFQNVINDGQILKLFTIDESFLREYLMRELRGDKNGDRRSNDSSNR